MQSYIGVRTGAGRVAAKALMDVRELHFVSGSASLPSLLKENSRGEDAYFVQRTAVGIADGVGGWLRQGIDAGEYSRELMKRASDLAIMKEDQGNTMSKPRFTPEYILKQAYDTTNARGSTTACIVQICENKLRAVNLGDSGFMLCRIDGEGSLVVLYESEPQQHAFNCPLQLGNDSCDLPQDAESVELEVQPGDMVITATDGLFDNLFIDEITGEFGKGIRGGDCMKTVALSVAQLAQQQAQNTRSATPFSKAARSAGYRCRGGKMDDITVIASKIVEQGTVKDIG